MKLRPTSVLLKIDREFVDTPIEKATVGTIALLRPGDRIALDGEIVEGIGEIDESSLTGEAIPVTKAPGSKVFAGTINQTSSILYRITHLSADSTLARIIHLVEKAQNQKAATESFLERAERYYAGFVILALSL